MTLLIGTDFVEQRFDTQYGNQASAAGRKIEAVLPEDVKENTARLRQSILLLNTSKDKLQGQEKEYMEQIRRAILEQRKISFGYTKGRQEADGSHRSVEPLRRMDLS